LFVKAPLPLALWPGPSPHPTGHLVTWSPGLAPAASSRHHVGIVGIAYNIKQPAAAGEMLTLLAVGFYVPTMPTYAQGFFARGFWLLALLAV